MGRYEDLLGNRRPGDLFSRLAPLDSNQKAQLPDSEALVCYADFLREAGFGEIGEAAFMLYSGAVDPRDVFSSLGPVSDLFVLVGDNFGGRIVGLRLSDGVVVEIASNGDDIEIIAPDFETFVRGKIAELGED